LVNGVEAAGSIRYYVRVVLPAEIKEEPWLRRQLSGDSETASEMEQTAEKVVLKRSIGRLPVEKAKEKTERRRISVLQPEKRAPRVALQVRTYYGLDRVDFY
jgi:hypothetical protein